MTVCYYYEVFIMLYTGLLTVMVTLLLRIASCLLW